MTYEEHMWKSPSVITGTFSERSKPPFCWQKYLENLTVVTLIILYKGVCVSDSCFKFQIWIQQSFNSHSTVQQTVEWKLNDCWMNCWIVVELARFNRSIQQIDSTVRYQFNRSIQQFAFYNNSLQEWFVHRPERLVAKQGSNEWIDVHRIDAHLSILCFYALDAPIVSLLLFVCCAAFIVCCRHSPMFSSTELLCYPAMNQQLIHIIQLSSLQSVARRNPSCGHGFRPYSFAEIRPTDSSRLFDKRAGRQ